MVGFLEIWFRKGAEFGVMRRYTSQLFLDSYSYLYIQTYLCTDCADYKFNRREYISTVDRKHTIKLLLSMT